MIVGDHYAFDLGPATLHGSEWIVLELIGTDGRRLGCRWHVDAGPQEIAVSLRALADKLDPEI